MDLETANGFGSRMKMIKSATYSEFGDLRNNNHIKPTNHIASWISRLTLRRQKRRQKSSWIQPSISLCMCN